MSNQEIESNEQIRSDNRFNEDEQYNIEILRQKLKQEKQPVFNNTEQEVGQYISKLKSSSMANIQQILDGHKDRMFASDLQIDPQSKTGRSRVCPFTQSERVQKRIRDGTDDEQEEGEFQENQEEQQQEIQQQQKQSAKKQRGAMWRAQNRGHADFEYEFKAYLEEKADRILNPPAQPPQKYQPIILKTNEKTSYEKGVDDSEIGSEYSALTDFAYKTAADIMDAYHKVFESQEKEDVIKSLRIKDFKDDEIFLLTQFYQLIRKKSSQKEYISKEELEKNLLQNPYILQAYNISPADLNKIVDDLDTKKQNLVSRQEMIEFLLNPVRGPLRAFDVNEAEALLKNRPKPQVPKQFILKGEDFKNILNVFNNLDTFGDHRIQVKQLVHTLRRDPKVIPLLPKPCVYIKTVKKSIPVDRIIFELEQFVQHAPSEELRKQRATITYEDFVNIFQNYHRKEIPTKDEVIKAARLTGKFESGDVLEIPKDFVSVLKDVYGICDKTAEIFVRKYEYSEELAHHIDYNQYKNLQVREKEFNGQGIETVEQALRRMVREADEFVDLDEIIDFFTRKGRPTVIEKAFQERREKERREKALNQWNREEFSSPDEQELKKKRKARKITKIAGLKAQKKIQRMDAEKQKQHEKIHGKAFGAIHKDSEEGFKITVPQPYAFDKREKNRKEFIVERRLKEDLQAKKDAEDKIVAIPGTFRANKVPKHVSDRNLLKKIERKQNKRREEVKKHSKTMTKLNENPFSFYYRDQDKEQKFHCYDPFEEQLNFQHFQAKPAPWYTRVLKLERMYREQAQKSREYVQRRMKELKEMSSLPTGVKHMMERLKEKDEERQRKMNELHAECTFQPKRAKPIPDFNSLQKAFQESLDEHKLAKALTVPEEFNFQETRKAPVREYLDKENTLMKQTKEIPQKWLSREKKIERLKKLAPKQLPPSTKKFDAMVEKRKRDEELKFFEEEQKEQREQDKQNRREQFAQFVRSSGAIQDNTNQLEEARMQKIQQRRMEQQEWEQQFDQLMTNMMKRVIRKPLLVETQSENNYRSDRVSRLKWLLGEVEEQPEEFETENYHEGYPQQEMFDNPEQQQYMEQQQNEQYEQQDLDPEQLQQQQMYYEQQQQLQQQQQFENEQMYDENMEQQQQEIEDNDQNPEINYEEQDGGEEQEEQEEGEEGQEEVDEDENQYHNQSQQQPNYQVEQNIDDGEEDQIGQEDIPEQQVEDLQGEGEEELDSDELQRQQILQMQQQQLIEHQQNMDDQDQDHQLEEDQFGNQQPQQYQMQEGGEEEDDDEEQEINLEDLDFENMDPEQRQQVIQMLREQGYEINDEDINGQQYQDYQDQGEYEGEEPESDDYQGGRQHSF